MPKAPKIDDATKLAIVTLFGNTEYNLTEIAAKLKVSTSTVSRVIKQEIYNQPRRRAYLPYPKSEKRKKGAMATWRDRQRSILAMRQLEEYAQFEKSCTRRLQALHDQLNLEDKEIKARFAREQDAQEKSFNMPK